MDARIELEIETDGNNEKLFFNWVIAADGRNSSVVPSPQEAQQSILNLWRGFGQDERTSDAVKTHKIKCNMISIRPW